MDEHGRTPSDHADVSGKEKSNLENQTSLASISHGANCRNPDTLIHESGSAGMTMRQVAAQSGLIDWLQILLDDHPSSDPDDTPEALVKLANHHSQSDVAAFLHAHMATRAIEEVLQPAQGMRSARNKS